MNQITQLRWWCAVLLIVAFATAARAQVRYPARIGQREFVLDEAGVISNEDRAAIQAAAAGALDSQSAPIVVVTMKSLADRGAGAMTTRAFAEGLFNEWGLGAAGDSRGLLMLVVIGDRQVWIATGRGWGHAIDTRCGQVVDGMLPAFRKGDYSGGIRGGVVQLAGVVRGGAGATAGAGVGAQTGGWRAGDWLVVLLCPIVGVACLAVWVGAFLRRASGRRSDGSGGGVLWVGDGGWAGGGFGGGGDGGGGGGSFGGGDCGGGGAGGSW